MSVGITPTPPLRMAETASSARHTSEPSSSSTVYATSALPPPGALRLASILAGIDRDVAAADGAWAGRNAAAVGDNPVHTRNVLSIACFVVTPHSQRALLLKTRKFEIVGTFRFRSRNINAGTSRADCVPT